MTGREMSINMNDVTREPWAQRVSGLSEGERERRIEAVDLLLDQPDDLSTPLETELYILRDYLTKTSS